MNFGIEKFDIILLSGQSNAEGSGVGFANEEYTFDGKAYRMLGQKRLVGNDWEVDFPVDIKIEEADSTKKDDLAVAFAYEYIKAGLLEEGRKVLIVETALGGTGFRSKVWRRGDFGYKRMMYMLDCALNMNSENRLVAFLWHQGENEASSPEPREVFATQLSELFADVRKRSNGRELPIISGDFCYQWKLTRLEECNEVIEVIKRVTESFGGAFVETSDLPSNDQDGTRKDDNIHFSRNSIHILGRRYFDAYKDIIDKK